MINLVTDKTAVLWLYMSKVENIQLVQLIWWGKIVFLFFFIIKWYII